MQELDEKHASLHKELLSVKEALSQMTLQKEMLEDDKASLTLALAKVFGLTCAPCSPDATSLHPSDSKRLIPQMEIDTSSQQRALTQLQNQQAALEDSLAKMAALNEGLAKDKVELSRLVLQVSPSAHATDAGERRETPHLLGSPFQVGGEKTEELDTRRRGAEAEQAAAREEAARSQTEMMNFLAEKRALECAHVQLQDVCQKLESELSLLQKEKSEALEKCSQVRDHRPFTPPQSHHLEQLLHYY